MKPAAKKAIIQPNPVVKTTRLEDTSSSSSSDGDDSDTSSTSDSDSSTPNIEHKKPQSKITETSQSSIASPNLTPTHHIETNDRISKEKQKFFRLSAFNADKKRTKVIKSDSTTSSPVPVPKINNNKKIQKTPAKITKVEKVVDVKRKPVAKVTKAEESDESEKDSSSDDSDSSDDDSSDCSSSDCSDDDSSSDSDSDTSEKQSESSRNKVFGSKTSDMLTFGTISSLSNGKDTSPWGFAAAAAAAKDNALKSEDVKSDGNIFSSFTDKNDKNQQDKSKSGFGQLKGLFDGLSHFFAAPTQNRRPNNTPNYSLSSRRKRINETEPETILKKEKIEEIKKLPEPKIILESKKLPEVKKLLKPELKPEIKLVKIDAKLTKTETLKIEIKEPTPTPSKIPKCPTEKKVPTPGIFAPSVAEEEPPYLSPSSLVKTAANSKQHRLKGVNNGDVKHGGGTTPTVVNNKSNILDDISARIKKRSNLNNNVSNNIVDGGNSQIGQQQSANNQTGKIGLLPLKQKKEKIYSQITAKQSFFILNLLVFKSKALINIYNFI